MDRAGQPGAGQVQRQASGCPGCGLQQPLEDGPTHRYMTSSAACWRAFGELLATCYSDASRLSFRQVVVDAYAAQHPGDGRREQVQSVGIHLMTLCLFLERGVDPSLGSDLHRRMIRRPAFHRLTPSGVAQSNVLHVPVTGPPVEARARAYEWGRAVWDVYAEEHDTVRLWLEVAGFPPGTSSAGERGRRGRRRAGGGYPRRAKGVVPAASLTPPSPLCDLM